MALNSYGDLVTSVQGWMARGDALVIDRIPDFIRLGEERIFRKLRVSQMIVRDTLTIPPAQNWVALPSDWLAFKRINTDTEQRIDYTPDSSMLDIPAPGKAYMYSLEGRRLIYGQTPAAPLVLNVSYYARPIPLATSTTNWLLDTAPSVYLYAALIEGAQFIKNSQAAGEWGTLYDRSFGELQGTDAAAMVSGSQLRQRPQ